MRQDYFALRRAKPGASTDAKVAASQALLAQRQLLAQQLNLTNVWAAGERCSGADNRSDR